MAGEYGIWCVCGISCLAKNCCCSNRVKHDSVVWWIPTHLTAIFLVIYSKQHYWDIWVHLNKNAYLQFGFVQHIYDAQYLLNSVHILFDRHNVLPQFQYKWKSPTNSSTLTVNYGNKIPIESAVWSDTDLKYKSREGGGDLCRNMQYVCVVIVHMCKAKVMQAFVKIFVWHPILICK